MIAHRRIADKCSHGSCQAGAAVSSCHATVLCTGGVHVAGGCGRQLIRHWQHSTIGPAAMGTLPE